MEGVVESLQTNPVQYLATVGRDGKAKCRSFTLCLERERKLWFCTNNAKEVYKDMQANSEVEMSVSSPGYTWIRLHGRAVFENSMEIRKGAPKNPIVKSQYGTPEGPIFEVFYLENTYGLIADSPGNSPYIFQSHNGTVKNQEEYQSSWFNCSRYPLSQVTMGSMMGLKPRPVSVSVYSARGDISG